MSSERFFGYFKPPFDRLVSKQSNGVTTLSVDCVIFGLKDEALNILLIKSDFPGLEHGFLLGDIVEPEESLDEAAYRVLTERTGLEGLYLEQVKAFGEVDRHPAGSGHHYRILFTYQIDQVELLKQDNELHWHQIDSSWSLAFDHNRILEECLARLRHKIRHEPVGFNLLPERFTLRELQGLYEAVLGLKLDRRNFRKKFFSTGLLIDLNKQEKK